MSTLKNSINTNRRDLYLTSDNLKLLNERNTILEEEIENYKNIAH
jgi:hypothetical protein